MAAEAGIVAQGTGRGGSTVSGGGGGGGGGAGFDPALWPVGREGFNPKVDHGHCASWVVAQLRDRVRWVPGLAMRGWSGRFVHRDEDTLAWHSEEAAHWQVMADAEKIIEDLVLRRLRLRPTVVTSMLSRDYLHAVCRLISEPRIYIDGLSGTSAGGMNAAVFADGFLKGKRQGAIDALQAFAFPIL